MHLSKLTLKNIRNITFLSESFSPTINIIIGDNAQGKTNLLEAVYYFATGKTYLATCKEREIINWNEKTASLEGDFIRPEGTLKIEIILEETQTAQLKKKIKKNNLTLSRIASLIGEVPMVFFSNEDLSLVKGSPSFRRRFLDIQLSQISPSYFSHLQRYQHILKQRNFQLKNHSRQNKDLFAIWDEQLAESGAKILVKRLELIASFNKKISHGQLSQEEQLSLQYISSFPIADDWKKTKEDFKNKLKILHTQELEQQATLCGPHRDDLEIKLNEKPAKLYSSQGQKRSIALALKFTELEIMQEKTGRTPILLLDDVFSELDEKRTNELIAFINNSGQTLISSAKMPDNNTLHQNSKIFYLQEGKVVKTCSP